METYESNHLEEWFFHFSCVEEVNYYDDEGRERLKRYLGSLSPQKESFH